ncbi:putative maltokinase [Pararobbsia alpina]|uniref:Maltokinase n=1 Tax=Pararobbsia alpina TaxID=621374 RepID=A0A6S7CY27_9BURK|nr:putative maltokinase [Pararobbsia alpina]CAB3800678.1 Maltokinase [Pararobbsia alpina]
MNAETPDRGKPGNTRVEPNDDMLGAQELPTGSGSPASRVVCPAREEISSLQSVVWEAYLGQRRWFACKHQQRSAVQLAVYARADVAGFAFAEFEVLLPHEAERYFLPLSVVPDLSDVPESHPEQAIARLDRHDHAAGGLLVDAFAVPEFSWGLLAMLKDHTVLETPDAGEIVFRPTDRLDTLDLGERELSCIRWLSAEQSNSSLVIDEKVVLKLVRRVVGGTHPEAEMTRYLTAHGYTHAGPLVGEVVRVDTEGAPHTLCILQGFIPNEGDAWSLSLAHMRQAVEDARRDDEVVDRNCPEALQSRMDAYCQLSANIGRRLGELHAVLASPTEEEAFSPQTATDEDVASWTSGTVELIRSALDILGSRLDTLNDADRALARSLLERRTAVLDHVRAVSPVGVAPLCFRIHGDLHLGQVLIADGDAYLIDFEGEPGRTLEERRKKASPLRDIAGMLRSLRYASATVGAEFAGHGERLDEDVSEILENFYVHAEAAFLSAYHDALAIAQLNVAGDEQTFSVLLRLFMLEKAAYEIRYEVANRPEWIGVPLRGLSELVDQSLAKP